MGEGMKKKPRVEKRKRKREDGGVMVEMKMKRRQWGKEKLRRWCRKGERRGENEG